VPHEVFDIPLTSYSAALLLASSLTMVLALAALQQNRIKPATRWLFRDPRCWAALRAEPGLTSSPLRAAPQPHALTSLFRVELLRAHRLPRGPRHRWGDLVLILVMLGMRGKLDARDYTKVEIAALLALRRHRVDRHFHRHLPHP